MVAAFAGWPDAAESATRAVRYLVRKLRARRFAEIDPEDLYDFTLTRPHTLLDAQGRRFVGWPGNDFYYHPGEDSDNGLILLLGTEPNLRWRAYTDLVLRVIERCEVQSVVTLGALLDAVPHTRDPQVSGIASGDDFTHRLEAAGVPMPTYQGPTGIPTVLLDACAQHGVQVCGLWGHSPHYFTDSPNPKLSHGLLLKLGALTGIEVDLERLKTAGEAYEAKVTQAVAQQSHLVEYVARLEQDFDASAPRQEEEIPSPDVILLELEEFLKSQRNVSDSGDDQP